MAEPADLGIVAIGRNEGERLRRCLSSIPQGLPVVYVDSGSTDGSAAFAREIGAQVVELDLSHPFTAARARNEGLARLLHRWPNMTFVQFVDGDCEFEEGWLQAARSFINERSDLAAVCGRRRERYPSATFYNRLCDEEWNTPVGSTSACGGDVLMRIAALQEVAGYDSALIAGEEPELCARLRAQGWAIWRLDAPMTIHDAAMDHFRQWWVRAVRSGYGYAQAWRKTKRSGFDTIYGRELLRAIFWSLGVPLGAVLLSLQVGLAGMLLAPFVWILQFARLSWSHGPAKGALLLVGKAAECWGAARYMLTVATRRREGAIFYK